MESITRDIEEIISTVKYLPAVSIISSFQPHMTSKAEVEYRLKVALKKTERQLLLEYPAEKAMPVIIKLQRLIASINYNSFKKSVAIFASPIIEKTFYLDIAVEDKVIANGSFEIQDLVYAKKKNTQYMVLILSGTRSKMYVGNGTTLNCIKLNMADHIEAYKNDIPQKIANFSDPSMISQALEPYMEQWEELQRQAILQQLDKAMDMGKLAKGIKEVWDAATHKRGRLLILEKNIDLSLAQSFPDIMHGKPKNGFTPLHVRNIIDDILEKILVNGGDVEFVENGTLENYQHIALIEYY